MRKITLLKEEISNAEYDLKMLQKQYN